MIRDALLLRPRAVFVDEAQLMDRPTLETAKYLADETGSTFVLITTDEYAPQIRRYRDIESRIGTVAQIGPVSAAELVDIYGSSGYTRTALEEVHRLTGGILRDVVRLIKQMDTLVELNQIPKGAITPAHVRRLASRLNLAGGAA
jgi:DNA transposition AAA+ family ATPase